MKEDACFFPLRYTIVGYLVLFLYRRLFSLIVAEIPHASIIHSRSHGAVEYSLYKRNSVTQSSVASRSSF